MTITGGFGVTIDFERCTSRQWVMGNDGVKRWDDNNEEVVELPNDIARCPGIGSDDDGWRDGCADCLRRTALVPGRAIWIEPPEIFQDGCHLRLVKKEKLEELELKPEALDQLFDDMGESGHCVCEETKQQAIATMTPLLPSRATNAAKEFERLRTRIEQLRGALKSASGWLADLDDMEHALECIEMAGDMEPPTIPITQIDRVIGGDD